jgi:hypothetical protein
MGKFSCYRVLDYDKTISEKISNWSPYYVSTLRAMYDEQYNDGKESNWDDMPVIGINGEEGIYNKLRDFNRELLQKQYQKIYDEEHTGTNKRSKFKNLTKSIVNSIKSLKKLGLPNEVINDRVNMLAMIFTKVVDDTLWEERKAGSNISREDIIKGVKVTENGKTVYKYGEQYIFDKMHRCVEANLNFAMSKYDKWYDETDDEELKEQYLEDKDEEYEKYKQIFENWVALTTIARIKIKQTEGVKLGNDKVFADYANEGNFLEDDTFNDFDPQEIVRDGFQKLSDSTSPLGSLSKEVRLALSRIPMPKIIRDEHGNIVDIDVKINEEDGTPESVECDDLSIPKYLDPVKSHQFLIALFKGAKDSEQMMEILRNYLDKHPKSIYAYVLPVLESNSELRTKFFVDLTKNSQPYSMIQRVIEKGKVIYKTILLNTRNSTEPIKRFLSSILRPEISSDMSGYDTDHGTIFDTDGKIRLNRLNTIINDITKYFGNKVSKEDFDKLANSTKETEQRAVLGSWGMDDIDTATKITQLTDILESLGINTFASEGDLYSIDSVLDRKKHSLVEKLFEPQNQKSLIRVITALKTMNMQSGVTKNQGESLTLKAIRDKLNHGDPKIMNMSYYDMINNTSGIINGKGVGKNAILYKQLNIIMNELEKVRPNKVERRAVYKDAKGKNISLYSDVLPSYLGDFISNIKRMVQSDDPKESLQNWIKENFTNASFFIEMETENGVFTGKPRYDANGNIIFRNAWLQELWNSFDKNGNIKEGSFADLIEYEKLVGGKVNDNGDPLNFENFTTKQHAISLMVKFWQDEKQNKGKESAWYPTFVLGDAGVQKFIHAKRYDVEGDQIYKNFYQVVLQEVDRAKRTVELLEDLKKHKKEIGDLKNLRDCVYYDGKGNDTFTFLRFLNDEESLFTEVKKNGEVHKQFNINVISDENKMIEIIKLGLEKEVDKFIKRMESEDLFSIKQANKNEAKFVFKELNFIDNSSYANIEEAKKGIRDKIKDYYINTKFATIEQFQLMTIETGFYKNTKDLQNRYKEIHATGTVLDLTARDIWTERKNGSNVPIYAAGENAKETCMYFDDIQLPSSDDFINLVKKEFGLETLKGTPFECYLKNTLTDGQGYRTLESYRKVMIMAGKWNDNYEAVYDEINDIREKGNIDKNSIQRLADLAQVFQPINPYMFTHEEYKIGNNTVQIPVQHKYSECILIPELMPQGSLLRGLAETMERRKLDLVCTTKVAKVGGFGQFSFNGVLDKNGLEAAMDKGLVHKLNYKDYRIQMNVPEHLNVTRLFGTQLRKLIMSHINYGSNHYSSYFSNLNSSKIILNKKDDYIDANDMNGRQLVMFYNSLVSSNMLEDFKYFVEQMSDIDKTSKALIQSVISNDRETFNSLLAYAIDDDFNGFATPLFEGGLEHDSIALLFSIFKNMVNKQKIAGGAAVQASALGLESYAQDGGLHYVLDDNKENILYAECEIPFDFKYTNSVGEEVELDYNDYVYPETGKPLLSTYTIEKGKTTTVHTAGRDYTYKYDDYKSFADDNGIVHIPKIEVDFPGMLNMVAYRIPTERDYSVINIKAVRFSHKTAGAVIKVPLEGTSIAGFDFDIDKLFMIRKEFIKEKQKKVKLSKDDIFDAWTEYFKRHPEIKKDLEAYRNKLFDAGEQAKKDFKKTHPLNEYFGDTEETEKLDKNKAFEEGLKYAGIKTTEKEESEINFLEYDCNKTPYQNNRVARNNMLLNIIQQRLQDKETLDERITPGGFANASKHAREMRELFDGKIDASNVDGTNSSLNIGKVSRSITDSTPDPEPNYDPTDPYTILKYNQLNQIAGKLIGIFANQNANAALASLVQELKLKDPIKFGSLINEEGDGIGANLLINKFKLKDGTVIDTSLTVAELLAASVDAVKDPVLNYLNLNTLTATAGSLLARLGYSTRDIGLLFNQPIVKDACEYAFNKNISLEQAFGEIYTKHCSQKDVDEINKRRIRKESGTKSGTNNLCDSNRLAFTIANTYNESFKKAEIKNDDEYHKQQAQVMFLMKDILKAASDLNKFVQATRFTASNSVGSTAGDLYNQQQRVSNYLKDIVEKKTTISIRLNNTIKQGDMVMNKPINNNVGINLTDANNFDDNAEKYLAAVRNNPFAYEQVMYEMNKQMLEVLGNYYPYETTTYKDLRAKLTSFTKTGVLSPETINKIHSDFLVYLVNRSANGSSPFSNDSPAININGENVYYYKETVNKKIVYKVLNGENAKNNLEVNHPNKKIDRLSNRDYFLKVFPTELLGLIHTSATGENGELAWLKEYPLFSNFQPEVTGEIVKGVITNPEVSLTVEGAMGMTKTQKDNCMDAWASLIDGGLVAVRESLLWDNINKVSSDEEADAAQAEYDAFVDNEDHCKEVLNRIGNYLFAYNFYKLGFGYHPTTFMHLCPNQVKQSIKINGDQTYTEVLRGILRGAKENDSIGVNLDNFAISFAQNNVDNSDIVFNPRGKLGDKIEELLTKDKDGKTNKNIADTFTLNLNSGKENSTESIWKNILTISTDKDNDTVTYRPFIKVVINDKAYLYAAIDNGVIKNTVSKETPITYTQISILGEKGKSLNYSSTDGTDHVIDATGNGSTEGITGGGTQAEFDPNSYRENLIDFMVQTIFNRSTENDKSAEAIIKATKESFEYKEFFNTKDTSQLQEIAKLYSIDITNVTDKNNNKIY